MSTRSASHSSRTAVQGHGDRAVGPAPDRSILRFQNTMHMKEPRGAVDGRLTMRTTMRTAVARTSMSLASRRAARRGWAAGLHQGHTGDYGVARSSAARAVYLHLWRPDPLPASLLTV